MNRLRFIKNYQFRHVILGNLIILFLLLADLLMPFEYVKNDTFLEFYSIDKEISGYKTRNGIETTNYIQGQTGETYKLGKISSKLEKLMNDDQIEIVKTPIFHKVKNIKIGIDNAETSFLYNIQIQVLLIISAIVLLLNILYSNTFLDICLAFVTIIMFYTSLTYIFYY